MVHNRDTTHFGPPLTHRTATVAPPIGGKAGHALGGLDILVNDVGTGAVGTVEDNGDDEWHRVPDVA